MILIQYPTRERPDQAITVLNNYIDCLESPSDCIININCDIDDESMNNQDVIGRLKKYPQVKLNFDNNQSKVEAVNKNIDGIEFDILIVASDDMMPVTKSYDRILKEEMNKNFPDGDGVLWFFDGHNQKTNTLPILGKKYYERFGYVYNPTYFSLFCDNDFQETATKLGKIKRYEQVLFVHEHPDYGKKPKDELYRKNYLFGHLDLNNYNKRKSEGFINKKLNKICVFYSCHANQEFQKFLKNFRHDYQLTVCRSKEFDEKKVIDFVLENNDREYVAYCSTKNLPPQIEIKDYDVYYKDNLDFFAIKSSKTKDMEKIDNFDSLKKYFSSLNSLICN